MEKTVQDFQVRLRRERDFRQRILEARNAGSLAETLAQEGFEFDPCLLQVDVPQVRTNLHGGQCYCLMSPAEREKR